MWKLIRKLRHDERGASLAVAAVMIMSLLAMIALAMDLGLLRTARGEAQRAADSGALAGAQEFLNYPEPEDAVVTATAKAHEFTEMNHIRNQLIDPSEVTVEVHPESRQVYVRVRRTSIPLWFARLFGRDYAPIAASAKAEASPASRGACIAPLALPDWWEDDADDGNNIPDPDEEWVFDPAVDRYERYNFDATDTETGFGSLARTDIERDRGRVMIIKPHAGSSSGGQGGKGNSGGNPIQLRPSFYHALDFDFAGYHVNGWGGAMVDAAKGNCPWGETAIGEELDVQTGAGAGPTWMAFQDIYDLDSGAYWHEGSKQVVHADGTPNPSSERILKFAVFDPNEIVNIQGKSTVEPNNFAYFFLENRPTGPHDNVIGRFIAYASGSHGGGPTGSLILSVRLIQ